MIDTDKYEGHTKEPCELTESHKVTERWNKAFTSVPTHYLEWFLEEVKQLIEFRDKALEIEQEHGRVTIDEWEHKPYGDADDYPLPYVTLYHGGCEYVGRLRLYKSEDGEVIE
tara:strand:- start:503 stop:841 length:339 start_codon:yes stop_codon:yes gene_type:complete